MTESVPMKNPLVGLEMDPDTAQYVGVLEGTIAALTINECKYRALLELLTGEPWEDTKIDFDGKVLMDLAVSALVKQTGMDRANAKNLVWRRWEKRNLPQESVVPAAVPVDQMVAENHSLEKKKSRDMSARLAQWKAGQQAAEAEIASETT